MFVCVCVRLIKFDIWRRDEHKDSMKTPTYSGQFNVHARWYLSKK